jgi:Aldehyde dehydrogenase family
VARPAARERILLRWADLIEAHADELAALETLNQGKSIHVSRMIDVAFGVEFTRYMAGWATKISGETVDVSIGFPPGVKYSGFTRREPVGVSPAKSSMTNYSSRKTVNRFEASNTRGGIGSIRVNANLKLTHLGDKRQSKSDPPWAPFGIKLMPFSSPFDRLSVYL